MTQQVNKKTKVLWFGTHGFMVREGITQQHVIDAVRDWAETRALLGYSGDYRALARKFDIPMNVVDSIEKDALTKIFKQ